MAHKSAFYAYSAILDSIFFVYSAIVDGFVIVSFFLEALRFSFLCIAPSWIIS